MWEVWTGDTVYNWHALHEEYGDIIRVNPNWVSIIKPEAWRGMHSPNLRLRTFILIC